MDNQNLGNTEVSLSNNLHKSIDPSSGLHPITPLPASKDPEKIVLHRRKRIGIVASSITCILIFIVVILLLPCKHEWIDATCSTPRTCSLCDATEGDPLAHTWKKATCTSPKICSKCNITDGTPVAHTWKAATCTSAKICSICSATEGNALGHQWAEYEKADYTNSKKTKYSVCSTCNAREIRSTSDITTLLTKTEDRFQLSAVQFADRLNHIFTNHSHSGKNLKCAWSDSLYDIGEPGVEVQTEDGDPIALISFLDFTPFNTYYGEWTISSTQKNKESAFTIIQVIPLAGHNNAGIDAVIGVIQACIPPYDNDSTHADQIYDDMKSDGIAFDTDFTYFVGTHDTGNYVLIVPHPLSVYLY